MHKYIPAATSSDLERQFWLEVQHLAQSGVSPDRILILTPMRESREVLLRAAPPTFSVDVPIQTFAAFALASVRERWNLLASQASGFHETQPPTYISFAVAQYLMHQVVQPFRELGFFEGLLIRPSRISTALLHTLNQATTHGLPLESIPERLEHVWGDEVVNPKRADHILTCLTTFRERCIRHNVIDFSLTQALFAEGLLSSAVFQNSLAAHVDAIIFYQIGECTPLAHAFAARLMDHLPRVLLFDLAESGVRFLQGAAPEGVATLAARCDTRLTLPPAEASLTQRLAPHLRKALHAKLPEPPKQPIPSFLGLHEAANHPRMLSVVLDAVERFQQQGVALGDIALIAPSLSPVTRFVLEKGLVERDLAGYVYLRQERLDTAPDIRALLTTIKLAYPSWDEHPIPTDVALMLQALVPAIDPVRASLLGDVAFDTSTKCLEPVATLRAKDQERLGPVVLEAYESIVTWLTNVQAQELPFASFLEAAQATFPTLPTTSLGRLKSLLRDLQTVAPALHVPEDEIGLAVLRMIEDGYAATDALLTIDDLHALDNQLLITTVQGFLLTGLTKPYQFWLDVGDTTWWASPIDPITHLPALSANWDYDAPWDANHEYRLRLTLAYRQLYHLLDHCTTGILTFSSEEEAFGDASTSPLLRALRQGLPPIDSGLPHA